MCADRELGVRRIRICYFNTWAGSLEPVADYARRAPAIDLRSKVTNAQDPELMRKARLDCDWYAANARCFAAMHGEGMEFLPAWVVGPANVLELAMAPREPGEERWLLTMAHQPQSLGNLAGKVFAMLGKKQVRHAFYAFDEASRRMPCFDEIAPYLDVLIHDESPLTESGQAKLKPGCVAQHRSWVANFAPGEASFNPAPEEKIYFLGSQMGLTPHRQRQLDFLRERFKDRFVASHDHSTPVDARAQLNRYKVGFCPEGRMFATPAMSASHTDRPFWSGCLGMVPLSENSQGGGRLESLHAQGLIVRYEHGDLKSLETAAERTLAMPVSERKTIFDHFNAHETVGAVMAAALAETK